MSLSLEFKKILSGAHVSMVLLWVVFLASIVIFLFIPDSVFRNFAPHEGYPYLAQFRNVIWLVGLAAALLLLWAKQRFYTIDAIFQLSKRPLLLLDLKGETAMEKGAARLVYFYKSRMVLALTLAELIALCGLIIAFISSNGFEGRVFFLTSLALLVLFYPSRTFFESLIKEYEHREIMHQMKAG